ncbi:D-2-hydroxyacid dehydrogenase [Luteolibacter sp. AS25]|uniref:D-2-hydroxyacid dehydrogenase n=1 Tax=Luteolibacter sp. AS25 TaxID=3135776 RepID=UPI00398BB8A0
MAVPTIFSDPKLDTNVYEILKKGVGESKLIQPAKIASSVLDAGEVDPAFGEAEIAFGQPLLESIYASENLKWIQVSSAGFTRYDTEEFRKYAKERGLVVTNSSSVYAHACAEHVFAFMLAQSRHLVESLALRVPNGTPEWNGLRESYKPLRGQSVLILGFGGIARELVKMLEPFGMRIVAMRRQPRGDEGMKVVTSGELPEALAAADHVINILPDNEGSKGFFDATRFEQMKPGAVFYNIGRGTTVDQEALFDALNNRKLGAAWLDVTDPEPLAKDHPLWTLENCHITPHTAGGHQNESLTLVNHFLTNYGRYIRGEELIDRVI